MSEIAPNLSFKDLFFHVEGVSRTKPIGASGELWWEETMRHERSRGELVNHFSVGNH